MPYVGKLTRRQKAFVRRFEEAEVKYFYTVMKSSHLNRLVSGNIAYQLEFPIRFLNAHAHEFTQNATLEIRSGGRNPSRKWPLGITMRWCRVARKKHKKRVVAYGHKGWRKFCVDNEIKLGDLLVFQLIGFSRFRAYLFPAQYA